MNKLKKLILRLLSDNSPGNFTFDDLCGVLESFGFENRIKGSHHIYFMTGLPEIINVQANKGYVKPYQDKQVRELLIKYKFITANE